MSGNEVFELWWLIPLALFCLCIFGARGCCFSRGQRNENLLGRKGSDESASALEILSQRYALGEIDDDEYHQKSTAIIQTKKGEQK